MLENIQNLFYESKPPIPGGTMILIRITYDK
jgi:hypothetical protein